MAAKKGSGKNKGSDFERMICKSLSLWFTNDERDDIFWRTAGSGGRATNRFKSKVTTANSAGDVGSLDPIGDALTSKIVFELKRGYNEEIGALNIIDGLGKKDPILIEWWEKAEKEKEEQGRKQAMIIFKRDRKGICIMMDLDFFGNLENNLGGFKGPSIDLRIRDHRLTIANYDDFLCWFSPEDLDQI